jgi:hypothetical protein
VLLLVLFSMIASVGNMVRGLASLIVTGAFLIDHDVWLMICAVYAMYHIYANVAAGRVAIYNPTPFWDLC